jgi:hypothetical protein
MAVLARSPRAILWMLVAAVALLTAAAFAASERSNDPTPQQLPNVSRVASLRVPYFTPKRLTARLAAARSHAGDAAARGSNNRGGAEARHVFNRDRFGLPQNEESVTACATNPNIVLSGTNDYRGLVDPQGNFTGWHFSNNGGRSLTNEGLLPPVTLIREPTREVPSGGDPVKVAGKTNAAGTSKGCAFLYAASLAYNPANPFGDANGIGVYRSTPQILASCPTEYPNNANPACWPTRRLVAEAGTNHFLDKEWFDVGVSGGQEWVWVTYSDFAIDPSAPLGFTGAEIFAVRCDRNLETCTPPIPISEDDLDVQFSDVTIAPDGRVYVTWADIQGELPGDPPFPEQEFIIKMRVAEPGSIVFGPERIVYHERKPVPFGGFMHANDWRIATYPKNDVALVDGRPRIFVVWDACKFRPLGSICEESWIKLTWSDNFGATWREPIILRGSDTYFPSIVSNDSTNDPVLAFTWFTNRYDRLFHNQQDVEYMTLDPARPGKHADDDDDNDNGGGIHRLTQPSNETESDPLLGGFFIGDYIEVFATGKTAYVAWNSNYRHERLLGPFGVEGIPVPQQDNYLARLRVPGGDDDDDDD